MYTEYDARYLNTAWNARRPEPLVDRWMRAVRYFFMQLEPTR